MVLRLREQYFPPMWSQSAKLGALYFPHLFKVLALGVPWWNLQLVEF